MTNNTALQVTNFNFYGDELIALKDNATGEIYTSINHVLRNIGFTERQIKHIHKKWSEDIIVAKGVQNFVLLLISSLFSFSISIFSFCLYWNFFVRNYTVDIFNY